MSDLTLQALTAPISSAEPCGPDLDALDDDDYMNVLVTAETVLPQDYMVPDHDGVRLPFDQNRHYKDLDLGAQVAVTLPLTERTRDLRVMMLLAKLFVLRKSLADFCVCVTAVADLLETRWDSVHPRPDDGGLAIRRETLQRLDDPLIVAGLTHTPLFVNKRLGAMTLHRYLAEAATAAEAASDDAGDAASLDKMLADEANPDLAVLVRTRDSLIPARDTLAEIKQNLVRIRAACVEHMSYDAPRIEALPHLIDRLLVVVIRIFALAEAAVRRIDPSAATEVPEGMLVSEAVPVGAEEPAVQRLDSTPPPGLLTDVQAASRALAAATDYFQRLEPSNPALLLLGQAQALIGKTFLEAMLVLTPDAVELAAVRFGTGTAFSLPLSRLTAAASPDAAQAERAEPDDIVPVGSRSEAVGLLDAIGAYYRAYEPSSPIPLLTDRARALSGKDFLSLLGEVSPKK